MHNWLGRKWLAGVLVVFSGVAYAEDPEKGPWEKFSLAVGGFVTESDTTFRVDSDTLGVGAVVDLENALGVERNFQTYRIDGLYRFGKSRRHDIEVHYFDSKRDGDRTLEEDLQIGDIVFPAGTGVTTEFQLQFFNVDYVYNFLMDDRVRLGASVGVHTTGVKLKVAESGGLKVEEDSFTAPLPMVGLRAEILLTPRWRLKTDLNVFYLKYDQYTGRLSDAILAVEYAPWKRVAIGAGFNSINYKLDADGTGDLTDFSGQLEFQLTGFMLYGRYFF